MLCGVVEQSASVTLRANSTSSYSDEEFAEYVENTSYITRYCQPPAPNESTVYIVRSIPHIEVRNTSSTFFKVMCNINIHNLHICMRVQFCTKIKKKIKFLYKKVFLFTFVNYITPFSGKINLKHWFRDLLFDR